MGGDGGVGAVVGEGDGDAVAVSQGGAAVVAGGTVARRGSLDHRGRRVDAEHAVARSHQDGDGAALPEADVEDRFRLGEVEFGERAVLVSAVSLTIRRPTRPSGPLGCPA